METEQLQKLIETDDITWKSLLLDLVKSEHMNPWDIDISLLTKKYIATIKEMQQLDLRVSGKVLLAAAILLKVKSTYFLEHGVDELDRLLARTNEVEDTEFFSEFSDELFQTVDGIEQHEQPHLIPRIPQPRHRKVTIYDLAGALQKAMEVKKRNLARQYPDIKMEIPKKKIDITQVLREVYGKIKTFLHINKTESMKFSQLLPEDATKEQKVYTFMPLLYLDHQRRVDLSQQEHFGEINIELLKMRKQVDKELAN